MTRDYDVLVQIDADLSHEPDVIPELLAAIEAGADVAIGSRYVPGGSIPHWPWYRRALSKYGNRYAAFVLGLPIRDATSGFRAVQGVDARDDRLHDDAGEGLRLPDRDRYRVWRKGGKAAEVPITFHDRVRGYSKMSWHIFAEELLLVTWWGFRDRVLRRGAAS